ncbi:MAG: CRTAC1 family protein [Myxococcales bacterium]|nr:CRTAC1 family protein [Myxococcales bacterium]
MSSRHVLIFGVLAVFGIGGCQKRSVPVESLRQPDAVPSATPTPAAQSTHAQPEPRPRVQPAGGHTKMVELLAQIKERAPKQHLYFGEGSHQHIAHVVESARKSESKILLVQTLLDAGYLNLQYEETPDKAIVYLTEALDLIQKIDFPTPEQQREMRYQALFYLGVSHLRRGEVENCCQRADSNSCIVPIVGTGIHSKPEGSQAAFRYLKQLMDETSGTTHKGTWISYYESARWLLHIAAMTLGEYPDKVPADVRYPAAFTQSQVAFPRFENIAPKLGMTTLNGAGGVAVDDFTGDDYLDVFTTSSNPTKVTRLFVNDQKGGLIEQTEQANLADFYGGLNLVQADYDNDGNLDVFVTRGAWMGITGKHPNSLFRNQGGGRFVDMTFEAGLGEIHCPVKSAAWGDYDNDGDVDLFVGNETSDELTCPTQLFRNNGDGTFTDVAAEAGVRLTVFVMGAVWGDYNNDRYSDLFVSASDGYPVARGPAHRLFRNNKDGTFTDVAAQLGIVRPKNTFATWFWDYDNNSHLDLFITCSAGTIGVMSVVAGVSHLPPAAPNGVVHVEFEWPGKRTMPLAVDYELAALYRATGEGGFEEVGAKVGFTSPARPMGVNFGDINGDGFLDFYLATGDVPFWELQPNQMFINDNGQRFDDVTMAGGFGHLQKGHGVSFADIDNDGDQDVYVQLGGQLPGDTFADALFENPGFGTRWVTIKLVGTRSNRSAIGAKIHVVIVENGVERSLYRFVTSGGSFGCNPLRQNIGLGQAERIKTVTIDWPTSSVRQQFSNVPLDTQIEIIEEEKNYRPIDVRRVRLGDLP